MSVLTDDELPADVRAVVETGRAEQASADAAEERRRQAEEERAAAARARFRGQVAAVLVGEAGLPAALGRYVEEPRDPRPGTHRVAVRLPGCGAVWVELLLDSCGGLTVRQPEAPWGAVPPGHDLAVGFPTFARAAAAARAGKVDELPL